MSTSPPAPALRAVLVPSESAEGTAPPPGDQPSQTAADLTGTSTSPPSAPFPHLPSSCLAALLNYLPFQDVRQCLLAGKVMAVDAAHEVETLNIMRASEMVRYPVVRRFPNVSELNILSILSRRSDDDDDDDLMLNANAIGRALPFMMQFPKLEMVFLGGAYTHSTPERARFVHYSNDAGDSPHDHQIIFRSLIENLCGAFEARLLNPNLYLGGFELNYQLGCSRRGSRNLRRETADRPCRCCRGIIASFPIELVVESIEDVDNNPFCIPMMDQLEVFAKRRDGKEFLRTEDGKDLIAEIAGLMLRPKDGLIGQPPFDYNAWRNYLDNRPDPVIDAFVNRMKGLGADVSGPAGVEVTSMTKRSTRRMKESIAQIFDSSIDNIPRHLFGTRVPRALRTSSDRGYNTSRKRVKFRVAKEIVVRQTFDALVSCGFRLNPHDYILVDLNEEPALALLKEEIERDE